MSGLFGVVGPAAVEARELLRLAEAAAYRAPGGITCLAFGNAGLAHLALRPQDRPHCDPRRHICVSFDGRLDNRRELISRLSPEPGPKATDAALLAAAYVEWGEACTDHLLGDFAFAVWDAPRQKLLCAVDPLGIKPLHYCRVGALLCFASDAAQVLRHPAVPEGLDEGEIAAYLSGGCEDPERSFFAAVRKIPPGHRLVAERGEVRVTRYWHWEPQEVRHRRDEDYAAHFRALLEQAVADRLRDAGTFTGIAMSGGLDSTSVAALAKRAGSSVHAYTFVFDRLAECDERSYSLAMQADLGVAVEAVEAERLWSLESTLALPQSPDTPFLGWHTCYREILQRMTSQGSRVLLMGHGGDDLLRGSALIYAERFRRGEMGAAREIVRHARGRRESALRALYRQLVRPHVPAGVDRYLLRVALGRQEKPFPPWIDADFSRRSRGSLASARSRHRRGQGAREEIRAHLIDFPWYWRLANWHDRNAAAFGAEVRHPFLDRRLFEYVLAVPGEQLFRLGSSKVLLRRSMSGLLPERIRQRPAKTRFTSFLDFVLRERAGDEIRELLRTPRAAELGIFDARRLRSAYLAFLGDTFESRRALWYAITLEIWLRRYEALCRGRRGAGLGGTVAA